MELKWIHNKSQKLLKTVIFSNKYNQELYYTTKDGGQVIKKYFNDNLIATFERTEHSDPWEQEKEWLGSAYEEFTEKYEPMWHLLDMLDEEYHLWVVDNNWQMAMPLYGISKDGVYLDRLQRHSYVQEGREMEDVVRNELEKLWIEKRAGKLGKLEVEREQLIGINTNQTQQIETLLTDQSASDERIISLLKDIEGLQKESQDLRDKFIEHDLKELAIRKSGLIEKAINKGTQEVFDEFNEITSLPSP